MIITDTHAHLDFEQYAGKEAETVAAATAAGVQRIITVGTTLERSQRAVELAAQFDQVWAAVGVHPNEAASLNEEAVEQLHHLAQQPKVVAVGEIGFDFYHVDNPSEIVQERAFLHQTAVATDLDLPLIVHSREAESTTVRYLQRLVEHWDRQHPGVIHCFTGTQAFAEVCMEMGFLISFTGVITYPKNDALRQVVAAVPLEKMLIETDCPFLAPQAYRGQPNQPAYTCDIAQQIAEIKELSLDQVAVQTSANAQALFALPPVS